MAVRNCSELGENLQKIAKRLMANDNLIKLLYFEDKDPLGHSPLGEQQKKDEVFEKLIKVIPRVTTRNDEKSTVSITLSEGMRVSDNGEFRNLVISVETFVPLTAWFIKDSNLRPFAIMGEIQKSLEGKTINGLGKISGGDFRLNFLTEELSSYIQEFLITVYE